MARTTTPRGEETVADTRASENESVRPKETRAELRPRVSPNEDPFFIDPRLVPAGWTYEWKRYSINGMVDSDHMVAMREAGWRVVPQKRHPSMVYEMDGNGTGPIVKRGQVLMERPLDYSIEARAEDRARAEQQVHDQEAQIGLANQGEAPRTAPSIRRTHEAVDIPK